MTDEDIWSVPCYEAFMRDLPDEFALDSEATGLSWSDTAFGASLAWFRGEEIISGYIDFRYNRPLWEEIRQWILDNQPCIITHNFKFDGHKLKLYPNRFEDTCLATYILNEHYVKNLKYLAEQILKETTDEAIVLKETRKQLKLKISDGYDQLPLSVIGPYAEKDAIFTLRIWVRLQAALAKEPTLEEVYRLEKQLILCVCGTEIKGMKVDTEYVKAQIIALGDKIIELERDIQGIVGKPLGDGKTKDRMPDGKYKSGKPKFKMVPRDEFNPNSPIQVLEFLNNVGVPISNTDKVSLEGCLHPLAVKLSELRGVQKIRGTYFVPLLEDQVDGIVHPNFNLMNTKTKRFSSSSASDG